MTVVNRFQSLLFIFLLVFFFSKFPAITNASWSSDSSVNTVISNRIKDETSSQTVFSGVAASDAQGKIILNDPVLTAASPGVQYAIGVKPAGFLKIVVRNVDIAAQLGGACIGLAVNPIGDLNGDGTMEIADLVEVIQHYLGTKVNTALSAVFGRKFGLRNIIDCIRNFVGKAKDQVE